MISQNEKIIHYEKLLLKQNKEIIKQNKEILKANKELEWAHIFHDSIKDKSWLNDLSLNIGRWAGNYSFFYVLNRILLDAKPNNILEFGLGESSKLVTRYIQNYLVNSSHDIVEQSDEWTSHFNSRFTLAEASKVHILPLTQSIIKSHNSNGYKDIDKIITKKYDLYIVDGPLGSEHYSRYDIVKVAENFTSEDEFIILFDDYNRKGERETYEDLMRTLNSKTLLPTTAFISETSQAL